MNNVDCELVTEFAKDKVWEESTEVFKCQPYIFAKQLFRQSRVKDKVDVIVTDSLAIARTADGDFCTALIFI